MLSKSNKYQEQPFHTCIRIVHRARFLDVAATCVIGGVEVPVIDQMASISTDPETIADEDLDMDQTMISTMTSTAKRTRKRRKKTTRKCLEEEEEEEGEEEARGGAR